MTDQPLDEPAPQEWQVLWPEHAEAISDAAEALLVAINSMTISGADFLTEMAAVEWCVKHLRDFTRAEIQANLDLGEDHP